MEKITVEPSSSTTTTTTTIQETHQQNSPTLYNNNNHRNRCCFTFPCFGPDPKPHFTLGNGSSSTIWDRFREGENENKWWASPIKAFKKIREWSEIVAGPKWKTFIRRFNRNHKHRHHHHHHHGGGGNDNHNNNTGMFHYDPLSYALNFDEKGGHNGHFDEECVGENFPDFSSRFAASASSARHSVDFGRNSS